MFPKENGVLPGAKLKPVEGAAPSDALPKPENKEPLGFSSVFSPKLKPFVFGGVATGSSFLLAPNEKNPGLMASSVLASELASGIEPNPPKLLVLVEAANSGVVVVVVVPPLVTVQLGFLPNRVEVPPMGVLGLPKENVAAGLGAEAADSVPNEKVGGAAVAAGGGEKLGNVGNLGTVGGVADVGLASFFAALSSLRSSFKCLS